ncbi:C6 zinc finger domain-containing protein [Corynespora cassiicola Philippines]|uniref:C6 zinc finger domain-containing protein n=1 Tax=Corynespora cassiicola Philippines TaxID=1448308 RepID=A0A2T2NL61_CORCC|nr:C6 zinc finger domain-containing protein [Corynespora cassiicola Philippines]
MTTPRRKACVECRQQKIRCDVEQNRVPHESCSRCKKMNLECRILPTSTRNLRQTKAEMRRELEELRWNMRHTSNDPNVPHSTPTSDANMQNYSPMDQGSATYSNPSQTDASASLSPAFENGHTSRPATRKGSTQTPTLPRVLDTYVIDPKRIEDCFALFFTQYHPLLPILDPSMSPNSYYELSPFLFWTIIVTGARRYSEDPSILDRISQLITPLAFSSMALRSTPIPVIQGLLILCTWRLSTNSMYKDMTNVLSGAAVHLATQIGLHVAGVGQDFARIPLKKDQDQTICRAKLWMHCVIVTSCAEGIPPLVIAESFLDGNEREREDMAPYLPGDLQFLHKMHLILLRAMSAMVRTDLQSIHCDASVLRSLISIFDSQLLSLAPSSPSELDTFQLNCVRIHLLAFHFFAHPTNPGPDQDALTRLYSLCVSTAQTAHTMVQQTNFATVCPSFVDRTMTLAGFAILKLCRSPLAQHLDLVAGEQAFFKAVDFMNTVSLQKNDLGARCAGIMSNLWGSTKIFLRKDGRVESLGLRLRTRLSMSVSFDMFWYWREEFGHMSNPYNGDESTMPSNAQTQPTTPGQDYEKEVKEITTQAGAAPAPMAKFEPLPISQIQPNPAAVAQAPLTGPAMSFDTWDGSDYNMPQILDQFPDYDWAASFDLSNGWPNIPMGPVPENAGYTFG